MNPEAAGGPRKRPECRLPRSPAKPPQELRKGRTTIIVPTDLLVRLDLFSRLHQRHTGERLTRGALLLRLFAKGAPKVSPQAWEDFKTLFGEKGL